MKLLAIETSTSFASVALRLNEADDIVEEEHTLQKHAEWVLAAVDRVLKKANQRLSDLDGIVFDEGPGSFTGLRIACSLAKGLALGGGLPLYPVSSLQAVYLGSSSHPMILTMIDARMQAWYWTCFIQGQLSHEARVSHPSDIVIPEQGPVWLSGFGFESQITELAPDIYERLEGQSVVYPKAAALISAVVSGNIKPVSALEAKPMYIRSQVASVGGKNG